MESLSFLTYAGHSTMLIEMDGMRLLTDPVLRKWVGPLRRQGPLPARAWHQRVDAVLISHLHLDHLDLPSLWLLESSTRMIAPPGAAELLARWGFPHVEVLGAGERTSVGSLDVEATPAEHSAFIPPFGPASDCVGFVVRGSQRVYFAGDTDVFPEMALLEEDLDAALLPVWGWGPHLGAGHMDPQRAAEALTFLRPRVAVPIHWGTFCPVGMGWMHPRFLSRPPRAFAHYAAGLTPEVKVRILGPGQSCCLRKEVSQAACTPAERAAV
jgi:L-ascorbate metabolism protein UlaG (beta-lactamase superfamily)